MIATKLLSSIKQQNKFKEDFKMANKYLGIQQEIEELKEKQAKINNDLANKVAGAALALGESSRGNSKAIAQDVNKLLNGLSTDVKVDILLNALGKIIVNM